MGSRTKHQILNSAEKLILTLGYNGFSYNDIAGEIGIRKASIHYHFHSKSELGRAVVRKYSRLFKTWCRIKQPLNNMDKIEAFGIMYRDLSDNCSKICPVSMLAAEYPALPDMVQVEIKSLIKEVETWLFHVLENGKKSGEFKEDLNSVQVVKIIYCTMSNAISMYRIFHNLDEIDQMIEQIKYLIRCKSEKN